MRVHLVVIAFLIAQHSALEAYHPTDYNDRLEVIAFGSCNRQNLPQPLWPVIASNAPDLWIWAGDNAYGDSKDPQVIANSYAEQLENADYQKFNEKFPIIGTWDDHDYGWNNATRDYPIKHLTQQLALDFTGVPASDPRRQREGIYGAYTFGPEGQSVKILLLDGRYFATGKKVAQATLIGNKQKAWLAKELKQSTAQIHLIVSGIQVLSEEHNYESWAKYPNDREWLLNLIGETNPSGVLFISGDRHIHELSVLNEPRFDTPLLDATSSGLTHSWESFKGEPNQHRFGEVHKGLGFGLITLDWSKNSCSIQVEIRNIENQPVNQFTIEVPLSDT